MSSWVCANKKSPWNSLHNVQYLEKWNHNLFTTIAYMNKLFSFLEFTSIKIIIDRHGRWRNYCRILMTFPRILSITNQRLNVDEVVHWSSLYLTKIHLTISFDFDWLEVLTIYFYISWHVSRHYGFIRCTRFYYRRYVLYTIKNLGQDVITTVKLT